MFYSRSLLWRKGPLGNIWVAAHCYKKLKREQVTETNIPSTVDKIIPDVQLSYRVLAHLLLGVVRIFSKKVDYLFYDCNEILVRLGRLFLSSQWNTPKEKTGGHHHKVSQPEGAKHEKCQSVALHEEGICASVEAIRGAQHDISLTLPKSFELDSFDLEVPEEEENASNHEQFRLEVEEELYQPAFMNARHGDDMITSSGLFTGCFTPVGDVIPSGILDIDLEVSESQQASILGVKQKLQGDLAPLEECGNHSSARRSLKLSIHSQELEEQAEQYDLQQAKHSDPSHTSPEGYAEVRTPVNGHGRVSLLCASEEPSVIVPKAASPEFAVATPARKERRWMSRKRKCLFDETIVLSNDILRQWIHDGSSLTCKRRKVPHTFLDVWKAQKMSNIENSLMGPLIPCNAVFLESSFVPSPQDKSANLSHEADIEKTEVRAEPEQRDGLLGKPSIEVLPSVSSAEVPSAGKVDEDIFEEPLATEKPESEISLIDREFSSIEEESNNQDGWSTRTRSVARYFCHCFDQGEKGTLSLCKVLEGKQRTKCAKLFYETLVLTSRGYLDVEQEFPYGDVVLSATPAMKTAFECVPEPFEAQRTLPVTGS